MGLSIDKMLSARNMTLRFVISIWDDGQRAKRRSLLKAGTNAIPPPRLHCSSSETSSLFFDLTLTLCLWSSSTCRTDSSPPSPSHPLNHMCSSLLLCYQIRISRFLFCSLFLYHSVYVLIIFFDHILTPMWKNWRLDLDLIWSFFFFFSDSDYKAQVQMSSFHRVWVWYDVHNI